MNLIELNINDPIGDSDSVIDLLIRITERTMAGKTNVDQNMNEFPIREKINEIPPKIAELLNRKPEPTGDLSGFTRRHRWPKMENEKWKTTKPKTCP